MLNKLLKRCMPWMDKGRWYKIVLEPTNNYSFAVAAGTDPAFQNAVVSFNSAENEDSIISIQGAGIMVVDAMLHEGPGRRSSYSTCMVKSSKTLTQILTPANLAVIPGDNPTVELLVYGR